MTKLAASIAATVLVASILACSLGGSTQPGAQATLAAPGPGITSQRELTPQESTAIYNEAAMDKEANRMLGWAANAGYFDPARQPTAGAEVLSQDGSRYQVVALGSAYLVKTFLDTDSPRAYFLTRVSGTQADPVLTIFDESSRFEVTRSGYQLFDSAPGPGRESAPAKPATASRPPVAPKLASMAMPAPFSQAQGCEEGSNAHKFRNCVNSYGGEGWAAGALCGAAVMAMYPACSAGVPLTLGSACAAAIATALGACGVTYGKCAVYSFTDSPPEVSVSMWQDTGETQPETTPLGPTNFKVWEAKFSVTDDREPWPISEPSSGIVRAVSGETATITAEDCGHNQVTYPYTAPAPTSAEVSPASQPPAAQQPAGPPASAAEPEYLYDGYWSASYPSLVDGSYTCDAGSAQQVSWVLTFKNDGSIVLSECEGPSELIRTDCRITFEPDETTDGLYQSTSSPGYSLGFRDTEYSRLYFEHSGTKEGARTFCAFEFTRR